MIYNISRKISIKINKNVLYCFILFLPVLKPACLPDINPFLDNIFDYGRIASLLIITIMFLIKKRIPSIFCFLVSIYGLWILFTTFINFGNIFNALVSFLSILSAALIIDYFLLYDIDSILKALFYNFEWLIYASFISIIKYFPKGMYLSKNQQDYYFLGNRNSVIVYLIPALFFSYLYIKKTRKIIRPYLLMIIGISSIFIIWSATSIVVLFVFFFILYNKKIFKKNSIFRIILIFSLFDILVSKIKITEKIPFLSWFIKDILKKETDMTGRILIWKKSEKFIKRKFLIGYGLGNHILINGTYMYSHNLIYELFMRGGLIGSILFFIIVFYSLKKLMNSANSPYLSLFIATFASLCAGCITEARLEVPTFIILSFICNSMIFKDKLL